MNEYESVDDYISQFPKELQKILEELRKIIKKTAPDSKETINYGIPTYKLNGNLVHFAGFKKHIGFYPTPAGIEKFRDKLSKYKLSKGTIQFPINKPLPLDLIRKIVILILIMLCFSFIIQGNVLVSGLQQNEASITLFWSKQSYYQNENGTVIINL